jgi:tetratricopeptide (TPR) repeat protein
VIAVALLSISLAGRVLQMLPTPDQLLAHGHSVASFEQLSQSANRAREENRDDDAILLYKQALFLKPEWREGLWYLGALYYEKEHYSDARDVLRRFVALQANAGPGWALLGMSEFQTREYPRAFDHLERAMALGMGDRAELKRSVFYFATILLTRFERYDDSMSMLVRMIALEQTPDSLIDPAGLAGLRMPLLPAEIPADRRELVRLAGEAVVALQTQHNRDAEASFKRMEAAYPQEPGVHFLYGAYLMQTRPEDGIQEMKRELEISPSHTLARVRLAEQYLQQEQIDQALPFAEEAVKLEPERASAHMVLGEVRVGKGDLAGGIQEFETARDKDPLTVRTHWDLLRAYGAAGRAEDAQREKGEIEKLSRAGSENGSLQDGK